METVRHSKILILDFGSQYTQVIARRIRELQVYSEIVPFNVSAKKSPRLLRTESSSRGVRPAFTIKARPTPIPRMFSLGIPVLGVCYGLMLMAEHLDGKVVFTGRREYGAGLLRIKTDSELFDGLRSAVGRLEQPWRRSDCPAERFSRYRHDRRV